MPFIKRSQQNHIVAVYAEPRGDAMEEVPAQSAELRAFLGLGEAVELAASDREMARVAEDLVNVLIDKGIILLTDLPTPAQEKLLRRGSLRRRLGASMPLITDEDDLI